MGRNRYSSSRKETTTGARSSRCNNAQLRRRSATVVAGETVGQVISINRETVEPASMEIVKRFWVLVLQENIRRERRRHSIADLRTFARGKPQ